MGHVPFGVNVGMYMGLFLSSLTRTIVIKKHETRALSDHVLHELTSVVGSHELCKLPSLRR